MKGFIIVSIVALSSQACFALSMTPRIAPASANSPARLTNAPTRVVQKISNDSKSVLARVTVYWASGGRGSDRYSRHHRTATGCRLQNGHCAVDPRHIPYGSQVILADGTKLAAVDTGSAVRNRKAARKAGHTAQEKNALVIDRFFETKRQALAWAATHPLFMPVRVETPKNPTTEVATATISTTTKNALASNRQISTAGTLNKLGN